MKVYTKTTLDEFRKIMHWCVENSIHQKAIGSNAAGHIMREDCWILDEADAIVFVLAWSQYQVVPEEEF